jgi:hypothetical protein
LFSLNVTASFIPDIGDKGKGVNSLKSMVIFSRWNKGGGGLRVYTGDEVMGMQHDTLLLQRRMYLSSSKHRLLQCPKSFFQHFDSDQPAARSEE